MIEKRVVLALAFAFGIFMVACGSGLKVEKVSDKAEQTSQEVREINAGPPFPEFDTVYEECAERMTMCGLLGYYIETKKISLEEGTRLMRKGCESGDSNACDSFGKFLLENNKIEEAWHSLSRGCLMNGLSCYFLREEQLPIPPTIQVIDPSGGFVLEGASSMKTVFFENQLAFRECYERRGFAYGRFILGVVVEEGRLVFLRIKESDFEKEEPGREFLKCFIGQLKQLDFGDISVSELWQIDYWEGHTKGLHWEKGETETDRVETLQRARESKNYALAISMILKQVGWLEKNCSGSGHWKEGAERESSVSTIQTIKDVEMAVETGDSLKDLPYDSTQLLQALVALENILEEQAAKSVCPPECTSGITTKKLEERSALYRRSYDSCSLKRGEILERIGATENEIEASCETSGEVELKVKVVVGRGGIVKNIEILESKGKYDQACVENAIRRVIWPRFRKEELETVFPILLGR